jgi:hypothetical protein
MPPAGSSTTRALLLAGLKGPTGSTTSLPTAGGRRTSGTRASVAKAAATVSTLKEDDTMVGGLCGPDAGVAYSQVLSPHCCWLQV